MPAKSPSPTKKIEQTLKELGQRIRSQRKKLKISSTVTAEAAEVSRMTLYRIEKGEVSVTIGAYLSVVRALGLQIEIVDPLQKKSSQKNLPSKIAVSKFKELKKLAWQLKADAQLTPQEALSLYERNWRHVDFKAMSPQEKKFLGSLLAAFGKERLLV